MSTQYTLDEVQTLLGVPRDTSLQSVFEEFAKHTASDPVVTKTAKIEQELLSYHLDVHFVEARESIQAKSNEECGYFQRHYLTRGRCDVPNIVDDNAWQNRLVVFAKLGEANADAMSNHALQHALNALGAKSALVFETIDMLLSMGDASRLTKRALMSDTWASILANRQLTTNVLLRELNSLLSIGLLLKPLEEIKDALKNVMKFLKRMHEDLKRQWEFINGTNADEGAPPPPPPPTSAVTSKSKPRQHSTNSDAPTTTTVQSGMKLFSTELQALPPLTVGASRSRSPSRGRVLFQEREVMLAPSTAGPVGEHLLSPVELHRAQTSEISVKWSTGLTYIAANVLLALLKYLADARRTTDWQASHQATANFVVKAAAQAFGYDPVSNWRVFYVPYVIYQWMAWLVIGSSQQSPPWDWLYREFVLLMLRTLPTPLYFAAELTINIVSWVTLAQFVFNAYVLVNTYRHLKPLRTLAITNVERAQITRDTEHAVINRLIEYASQTLQNKRSQRPGTLAASVARRIGDTTHNDDNDDGESSSDSSGGNEAAERAKRTVDIRRVAAPRNIDQILARPTQSPYSRSSDTPQPSSPSSSPPPPPPMIPSAPTSPRRSLRTRKAK